MKHGIPQHEYIPPQRRGDLYSKLTPKQRTIYLAIMDTLNGKQSRDTIKTLYGPDRIADRLRMWEQRLTKKAGF